MNFEMFMKHSIIVHAWLNCMSFRSALQTPVVLCFCLTGVSLISLKFPTHRWSRNKYALKEKIKLVLMVGGARRLAMIIRKCHLIISQCLFHFISNNNSTVEMTITITKIIIKITMIIIWVGGNATMSHFTKLIQTQNCVPCQVSASQNKDKESQTGRWWRWWQ